MEFAEAGLGAGSFIGGYVIGLELLGPNKRAFGGTVMMCADAFGHIALGFLAMFTRSFKTILITLHASAMIGIFYLWVLPESFRWLLINGRENEGLQEILKAAKINKVILSESTLNQLKETTELKTIVIASIKKDGMNDQMQKNIKSGKIIDELAPAVKESLLTVFQSRVMLIRLINCCFCWFIATFVDYGLTINSVSLGGDKYVNFILTTLVEMPANILLFVVINKWGRRYSLSASLIVSGAACLAAQWLHDDSYAQLILFLIGKFLICMSFGITYMYTAELFPTSVRNSVMSTCSMIGRVGAMLAPQSILLSAIWPSLPLIIFGLSGIMCGLTVLLLPETCNKKLPNNMQEAIVMADGITMVKEGDCGQ